MTPASKDFVTSYLIHFIAVHSTFFNRDDENEKWNNHVELGLADIIIIPATANTMSKMANGTCDNLLLATYLSAKCLFRNGFRYVQASSTIAT
jgi:phosphopantothenoylcysteine decarboxylase/phosphopantothenate--cysteine ligase